MIILLEGPDGTGKSTLAGTLCSRYGYEYLHFGIPTKPPMEYWCDVLMNIKTPTVIDRLHLSEDAYGPVYRDGSKLTDFQFWTLEGWLWARKTVLIMCMTDWPTIRENLTKSDGPYHDENQLQIAKNFVNLSTKTSLMRSLYNYKSLTSLKSCYDLVGDAGKVPGPVEWENSGMGTLLPHVWLVGDKPNRPEPYMPWQIPAVFQSTSGMYLHRALEKTSWNWSQYHLSNSRDAQDEPYDLAWEFHRLGRPESVVALGSRASATLAMFDIPHTRVPHPQWWRRFKHHSLQEYADEIRQAANI